MKRTDDDSSGLLTRDNLGFVLAKALQAWNAALYQGFCEAGYDDVRPSYGSVLVPLFEEDGLRMGVLAERASVSKQAMTALIRKMERAGLVYRQADPVDARASLIFLTERSRGFRPVAGRVLAGLDAAVREMLPEAELAKLVRDLKQVQRLAAAAVDTPTDEAGDRRQNPKRN